MTGEHRLRAQGRVVTMESVTCSRDGAGGIRLMVLALALGVVLAGMMLLAKPTWAADTMVGITVNGCPKDFKGISRNGTTYVPLRQGTEAVGGTLKWDEAKQRAVITSGGRQAIVYKSQGIMANGKLLIPLRMVGQALDARVTWDAKAKSVNISTRSTAPVPT